MGGNMKRTDHLGPRNRWEDNIKIDVREKGWGGVEWSFLAQVRGQWGGGSENSNKTPGFIKGRDVLD
jgi:hypothetical protein